MDGIQVSKRTDGDHIGQNFDSEDDEDTSTLQILKDDDGQDCVNLNLKNQKLGVAAIHALRHYLRKMHRIGEHVYLNADLSNNKLLNDALPLLAVIIREYPMSIRSLDLTHNVFTENNFAPVLVALTEFNYGLESFKVDSKYATVERTLNSICSLNRDFRLARFGKTSQMRFEKRKLSRFPNFSTFNVLTHLSLNNNSIREIPDPVWKLQNLKVLHLNENKIKRISPAIACLASLENLRLSHNKLRAIPADLGILPSLKVVDVSFNRLWRVPVSISMFVEDVNAVGNPLRGLNEELKKETSDFKSIHLWIKKNPLSIAHAEFADTGSMYSSTTIGKQNKSDDTHSSDMDDKKGEDATMADIFAKDDEDDQGVPDYVSPVDFGHEEDGRKGDEIQSTCTTILANPDFENNLRQVFIKFRKDESEGYEAYESFVFSMFRLFDPSVDQDYNPMAQVGSLTASSSELKAAEIKAASKADSVESPSSSSSAGHGSKFSLFKMLKSGHDKKDEKKKKESKESEKHVSEQSEKLESEVSSLALAYPPRHIGPGTLALIQIIEDAVKVYVEKIKEPTLLFREESALIELIRKFMKREGDEYITFLIAPLFVTVLHDGYSVSLDETKSKGKGEPRVSMPLISRDSFDYSERACVRLKSGSQHDSSSAMLRRDPSSTDGGFENPFVMPTTGRILKDTKSAEDDRRGREDKLFDQLFKDKKRSGTPNPGDFSVRPPGLRSGNSPLAGDQSSDHLLEKNRDRFLWMCRSFLSRLYNTVHRIPRPIRLLIQSVVGVVNHKFPGVEAANIVTSTMFFLRFICPEIINRKGLLEMEMRKDAKIADKLLSVDQTLVFLVKFLQYLANRNWDASGKMDFCNGTLKNESENIQDFYASIQKDDPSALEMRDFQLWLQSTQINRILPIFKTSSLSLCDSIQVFTEIQSKTSSTKYDVDEVEDVLVQGLGLGLLKRMKMVADGKKA